MSWTCKHLTGAEVDTLYEDGNLKRLYDDSKDKIENKNYDLYDSDSDLTDEDKLDYWYSVLKSHADQNVLAETTKVFYTIGAYYNNKIYMISANYFDTSDKTYNYCHALVGKFNDSKKYAFSTDFWTPQNELMKNLGSLSMVFYSTPGGSLSFRAETARGNPSLFDYSNTIQTEEQQVIDIDSDSSDPIATEDGSTQTDTSRKIMEKTYTTIKTVRPLK